LSPTVAEIGGLLVGSVGVTSEMAARVGIKTLSGEATKLVKARYFPGAKPLTMKLLFEAYTHKLIGAQMVGESTVAERVNELELAIRAGMTAEEMRNTERCYDPSLSLLIDVTIDATEKAIGIRYISIQQICIAYSVHIYIFSFKSMKEGHDRNLQSLQNGNRILTRS